MAESSTGTFIHTLFDTIAAYVWWAWIECRSLIELYRKKNETDKRHALLLAWSLPPLVSAGAYRPASFLRYGSKFGWRMSAISGPVNDECSEAGQYLLGSIPETVRIHRLNRPALQPSWRFFFRVDGGFLNALATVRLAFRTFKNNPPSVVIASGPPFHNFVAALYLSRLFRASLVLDYRDEWTMGAREFIDLGNVDEFWERKCLRRADVLLFATKSIHNLYLKSFRELNATQCYVLENGWEPADFSCFDAFSASLSNPGSNFILSYIGKCDEHALPGKFLVALLKVLERNPDLRERAQVCFIGRKSRTASGQLSTFKDELSDLLVLIDHLPKPQAVQLMLESSALLLLNEPHLERALTGKIFDYLASGRPILVFGDTGEMARLVSELGAGVVVPIDDPDALEGAMLRLQSGSDSGWRTPAREEFLRTHTRKALAKTMFEVLERM